MTLTASNLIFTIHSIIEDLKQDVFMRFNYNLDENITFLDLTRNLILLENVLSDESVRHSQELRKQQLNSLQQQHQQQQQQQQQQQLPIPSQLHAQQQAYQIPTSQQQNGVSSNQQLPVFQPVGQIISPPSPNEQRINSDFNPFNLQSTQESHQQFQAILQARNNVHSAPSQANSTNNNIQENGMLEFHKELLREYKTSVEEVKKQNKIIRAIVKEQQRSSTPSSQNSKLRQGKFPKNSRKADDDHHQEQIRSEALRLHTFDTVNFSIMSSEADERQSQLDTQKEPETSDQGHYIPKKESSKSNRNPEKKRHTQKRQLNNEMNLSSGEQSDFLQLHQGGKVVDVSELQKMRDKELARIRLIEKAIGKIEESSKITSKKQHESSLISDNYNKQRKHAAAAATTNLPQKESKRDIHKLNDQIYCLDKEIKSITKYIQNCILDTGV